MSNVVDWTIEEVGQWLESLGLADYRDNFLSHDIRGRELISLGRQDLKVRQYGFISRLEYLYLLQDNL